MKQFPRLSGALPLYHHSARFALLIQTCPIPPSENLAAETDVVFYWVVNSPHRHCKLLCPRRADITSRLRVGRGQVSRRPPARDRQKPPQRQNWIESEMVSFLS